LLYEIYKSYRGAGKDPTAGAAESMMPSAASSENNTKLLEEIAALKGKEEYARKTLIESQAKWTSFCRGILGISKELLQVFENPRMGAEYIKDAAEKVVKYEKILSANEEDLKDIEQRYYPEDVPAAVPDAYPKFSSHNDPEMQELSQSLSMISQMQPPHPLTELKYDKIKEFLCTAKDELKICAVLQALRWRMTRARHGDPRKEVIRGYIENDLLGLMAKGGTKMLAGLIMHPNRKVVEYIVCFLNVLASEATGAAYLVKNEELVKLLLELLKSEKGDTNLRQNALGALQKFSLHRTPKRL
jgi:hypothetical protein